MPRPAPPWSHHVPGRGLILGAGGALWGLPQGPDTAPACFLKIVLVQEEDGRMHADTRSPAHSRTHAH